MPRAAARRILEKLGRVVPLAFFSIWLASIWWLIDDLRWVMVRDQVSSLKLLVAIGLVWLLSRSGLLSPAVKHAFWFVMLIAVSLPVSMLWQPAIPGLRAESLSESLALAAQAAQAEERPLFGNPSRAETAVARSANEHVALASLDAEAGLALPVWIAGSAALGAWQLYRHFRFRTVSGEPAGPAVIAEVRSVASQIGVTAPRTILVRGSGSPAVCGLIRQILVLPVEGWRELNCEERKQILTHELAHIARGDLWVGWLQGAAIAVWWWNPLVWLVCRELHENADLACDAWVVESQPVPARQSYARALLGMLSRARGAPAPSVLQLGNGKLGFYKRRLDMICFGRFPRRAAPSGLLASLCLAVLVLPGWTREPPEKEVGERYAIYENDEKANFWHAAGWMNDHSDGKGIVLNPAETDTPYSKPTCTRVTCQLSKYNWVGITYLPDGQWDPERAVNLFEKLQAKQGDSIKCRFAARSKERARVQFKVGGVTSGKVRDSLTSPIATRWITLTPEWKVCEIDVRGDVSSLVGGFIWVCDREHNSDKDVSFDLDSIYYVKTEAAGSK